LSDLQIKHPQLAKGSLSGLLPDELDKPPTYYKTNAFTWAFQEIVETYGIANYRECNPALYTIITFPFQFGMMYGDIGHGAMILSLCIYLIFWKDEIIQMKHPL